MGSDVRLVVSDIDDTLIPRGTSRLPERTAKAIGRFVASGRFLAPVTGHIRDDAVRMFTGCPVGCATGAFVNGQMIYVDGRLAHQESVSSERLEAVAAFLDRHTPAANLLLYQGSDIVALTGRPSRLEGYDTAENRRRSGCVAHIGSVTPEKANIQCSCRPEEVPHLVARLSERFEDVDFVQPGAVSEIDVIPKGWSKAKGVQVLADRLGVALSEVVAVGDSDNDIAMLAYVPASYAVSSGTLAARRTAAHCLPSVGEEPVAMVLEAVLAGKMLSF